METSVVELLKHLEAEALSISRASSQRLRRMIEDFDRNGIPIDKTIPQILDDLHWYNFIRRSMIKSARNSFHSIYQRLSQFMDDVSAVLICSNSVETAQEAFIQARNMKTHLDELILSQPSVRRMLQEMLSVSDQLSAQLQGGEQPKTR